MQENNEQNVVSTESAQNAVTNANNDNGKGQAIASMVLGIISVVFWFFGTFAFISLILGIIGICLASSAKKKGYTGGIRTAGLVLSIIGTVGGGVVYVSCVACVGAVTEAFKNL